jgi:transposase
MAALLTRASIQVQGDFYLSPLSAVQYSQEQLEQEVIACRKQGAPLIQVERTDEQGEVICIAQGYETSQSLTAQVEGQSQTWRERRLLIQSMAAARAAKLGLQKRLQEAQQALSKLTVRRQGKARLETRMAVEEAITQLLKRLRVEGLLQITIEEQLQEQPVRAYKGRLASVHTSSTFTISSQINTEALEQAMSLLGWRVYASNHDEELLPLATAVEAYRHEFLVERNFSRLKGRALSLAPMYLQPDDHRIGLVHLLSIALRVLTLIETVVRQRLTHQKATLAGLFAGNPARCTSQPTTERLLEAFDDLTLTLVPTPQFSYRHVTPLSPLQMQILTLLGFSSLLYTQLGGNSFNSS